MAIGKVYLIGAGPGAADLITLRGIRAIRKSQVLILDYLLPNHFLDELLIDIKNKQVEWLKNDSQRKGQGQINDMMLKASLEGKSVARIKTGDPHIFGRGMEELEFLVNNGIATEVIPGLSAATAFSSLTDYALTQRVKGSSFAAVTARCVGGEINEKFPKADSLIIFMGVAVFEKVVEKLLADEWSPETPTLILEKVSMPWQRQVKGTLSSIAADMRHANIEAPAILIVGQAASLDEQQSLRPRILFTGLDPANFLALGVIVHWPAIKVVRNKVDFEKLPALAKQLLDGNLEYVIFTSRTTVRMFFEGLGDLGRDCRVLANAKVVACGAGTSSLLKENGIIADLTPEGMGSKAILSTVNDTSKNILLIQSGTATEALANKLASKLGRITRLCLHKVVPHHELGKQLPEHDVIYFTCPSGVRAYWQKYGKGAFEKEVWCIGDVTMDQINEYGIEAKVVNPYVS